MQEQIESMDEWLLFNAIDSRTGEVYGAFNKTHQPLYIYPEIAGYFLTYLAGRAHTEGTSQFDTGMTSIVQWLDHAYSEPPPLLTRIYKYSETDSEKYCWRNRYIFSFDIAMILRGLAHASKRISIPENLLDQLVFNLNKMMGPDGLKACRPHKTNHKKPNGWSVNRGIYQLKVAASLAIAAEQFNRTDLSLISQTVFNSNEALIRENLNEIPAHPTLYAIEGIVIAEKPVNSDTYQYLQKLAESFLQKNSTSKSELIRVDVLAQLVRLLVCIGMFTEKHSYLLVLLSNGIDKQGWCSFYLEETYSPNTWTTLFARQALEMACSKRNIDHIAPWII